jgi:hypothetical protein
VEQVAQSGFIEGKRIGGDSTTLEANAAIKSMVRRVTGHELQCLPSASGRS